MLAIAAGPTGTALGQPSIPDSCICYTDKQDIRCLECLINEPKKDSTISIQRSHIVYQEGVIDDLSKRRAKAKKRTRNASIISGGSGVILTVLLFFLIK